jgi:hypothetical protein
MPFKYILIKSFCGVQGRFFQKEPLAAGGIRKAIDIMLIFW